MKRLLVINPKAIGIIALMVGTLTASGCASDLIISSGPTPRVEDCMIVGQGTPAKFVCSDGKSYFSSDGKAYTSLQLVDIRTPKTPDKK